jgi:hypothetical protein
MPLRNTTAPPHISPYHTLMEILIAPSMGQRHLHHGSSPSTTADTSIPSLPVSTRFNPLLPMMLYFFGAVPMHTLVGISQMQMQLTQLIMMTHREHSM